MTMILASGAKEAVNPTTTQEAACFGTVIGYLNASGPAFDNSSIPSAPCCMALAARLSHERVHGYLHSEPTRPDVE